jgi:hypothetical protein
MCSAKHRKKNVGLVIGFRRAYIINIARHQHIFYLVQ